MSKPLPLLTITHARNLDDVTVDLDGVPLPVVPGSLWMAHVPGTDERDVMVTLRCRVRSIQAHDAEKNDFFEPSGGVHMDEQVRGETGERITTRNIICIHKNGAIQRVGDADYSG